MKEEPVWDEKTDAAGICQLGLKPRHVEVPLVCEDRKNAVAEAVLKLVPEAFDRVEFGTVWREREDLGFVGQTFVPVGEIEAGSALDQDMDRGRIALGDLAVKVTEMRLVHGLGKEEFRFLGTFIR